MDLKGIESNGCLNLLGLHYVYWGTSQVPRLRQARAGRPLPRCGLSQFFPSHDSGIKSTFHRGLKGDMRNGELAALVGPSVPATHRYLGFLLCGILCAELTLSTLFTIMRIKGGLESV